MKTQKIQTNVKFGNEYAVYRKGVEKGLKPLGMTVRAARNAIARLIQPIATIKQGDGLFVFSRSRLSENQATLTLSGRHITGQRKEGAPFLAFNGEGSPVEITLPRNAEPETIKQKALDYLTKGRAGFSPPNQIKIK